jgi:general secretion pathway protein D
MKRLQFCITCLVLAVLAAPAIAQFDMDDFTPPPPPWEQFKLNPNVRISLDFRNANPDAVLQKLSQASGIAIVKDPSLKDGLTLQSPHQISLKDAFAMLNAVLTLRNFSVTKEGNFLVIRTGGGGMGARMSRRSSGDDSGGFGGRSSSELRVYTIKYANATAVAKVINDVYANATDQTNAPTVNTTPGFPGGRRFRFGPGGELPQDPNRRIAGVRVDQPEAGPVAQEAGLQTTPAPGAGNRRTGPLVKASADDFSNSVIVNAPGSQQEQISRIIEQIDKETDQPQKSKVFPLKYASAADLAPVIQNVLASNAPRGRGGLGTNNVPIDQRFQAAARFGSASAAFGTVAIDVRTNSLVVTATEDNLATITQVLAQIDKQTPFATDTFVVRLDNARADIVAQLLNNSFSGRGGTTTNQTLYSLSQSAYGGNTSSTTNRSSNSTGLPGLNRSVPLTDPSTNAPTRTGTLDSAATSGVAGVAGAAGAAGATRAEPQGLFGTGGARFGGGGLFGSSGGANSSPTNRGMVGYDPEGGLINVRDLSGQVTVVADVNTNSVIIVSLPENRQALEQIVKQLDHIPEQVMIETLIVEVSLTNADQFGVEWNLLSGQSSGKTNFGLQSSTTPLQGLSYTLTGKQYGAFLNALKTDTKFEVLSTPRIFTSNNATAFINISQALPYVTSQTVDTNGAYFYNYSFLNVGIVLTVTPRITSNGYVTMDVDQTANDFVDYTSFNAPVVNQREANTTVSVMDGSTVVLGGIIQNQITDTVNKVPILGDIPLIGKLFQSKSTNKQKTELLVFMTPHVVKDPADAAKLREQTESQVEQEIKKGINSYRTLGGKVTVTTSPPVTPAAAAPQAGATPPAPAAPVPAPAQPQAPQQPAQPNPAPSNGGATGK